MSLSFRLRAQKRLTGPSMGLHDGNPRPQATLGVLVVGTVRRLRGNGTQLHDAAGASCMAARTTHPVLAGFAGTSTPQRACWAPFPASSCARRPGPLHSTVTFVPAGSPPYSPARGNLFPPWGCRVFERFPISENRKNGEKVHPPQCTGATWLHRSPFRPVYAAATCPAVLTPPRQGAPASRRRRAAPPPLAMAFPVRHADCNEVWIPSGTDP